MGNILFIINSNDRKIDEELNKVKRNNIYIASYNLGTLERFKKNNKIEKAMKEYKRQKEKAEKTKYTSQTGWFIP